MNVPVPQGKIDGWARFAEAVRAEAWRLHGALGSGNQVAQVRADLLALSNKAADALCDMEHAGASTPDGLLPVPEIPLELLNTHANRRLLRILEEAVDSAQRVDQERGNYSPVEPLDGPVTSELAEILARVRIELYGPRWTR